MLLVHTVFIAVFYISLKHQVCVISFGKMSSFLSYSLLCTLEYYNHLRLLKLPWCLYFSLELMLPIYICCFWVFPASSVYLSNSLFLKFQVDTFRITSSSLQIIISNCICLILYTLQNWFHICIWVFQQLLSKAEKV